jgi:hypothetical protein
MGSGLIPRRSIFDDNFFSGSMENIKLGSHRYLIADDILAKKKKTGVGFTGSGFVAGSSSNTIGLIPHQTDEPEKQCNWNWNWRGKNCQKKKKKKT